jgi:hypothetical protein
MCRAIISRWLCNRSVAPDKTNLPPGALARLTIQKIVIVEDDSYHLVASWPEFIYAVLLGQAVKKVGLGFSTYWTFVITQEPFDFAN